MNKYEKGFYSTGLMMTLLWMWMIQISPIYACIATLLYIVYGVWFLKFFLFMGTKTYQSRRKHFE